MGRLRLSGAHRQRGLRDEVDAKLAHEFDARLHALTAEEDAAAAGAQALAPEAIACVTTVFLFLCVWTCWVGMLLLFICFRCIDRSDRFGHIDVLHPCCFLAIE